MAKRTRRQFLTGLGGATLALPFLPSLLPREAWGATVGAPKRFILLHSGHCQAVEQWYPDHAKLSFTQSGSLGRYANLSSISGPISPVLNTAFDPLRNKLSLLARIDPTSSRPNHNPEVLGTGGVLSEATRSVDHALARGLFGGSPLNLYVRAVNDPYYNGAAHVSVKDGTYSPGFFNPSAVFQNLFGTAGTGTADPKALARRDLLVVDKVLAEFKALRTSPRLSKLDGQLLDRHLAALSDLETKLQPSGPSAPTGASCQMPAGPGTSPVQSTNPADYQVVIDQMFDLMEVGVKCGKVQVATLMMHVYDYFAGNVGFIPGINGSQRLHEDIGHAGSDELRRMKLSLNQWFAKRVARFLTNLDVIENAATGATYLDNCLVLWGNDQGASQNTGAHQSRNLPLLLAGGAGGLIKPGKYIEYGPAYDNSVARAIGGDEGAYKSGRPYNQVLVTMLQAAGLKPADYETGGVAGFGVYGDRVGTFDSLPGNHRREMLPILT